MSTTTRVLKLRDQSLSATPHISPERAKLITEFYRNSPQFVSEPVRRALAFKYLLENKEIYIGEDELIVGEKGNAPKANAHLS